MTALILIKRNAFIYYTSNDDTPRTVSIPETAISDLEVVNKEALQSILKQAIAAKPVHPSVPTVLVLGDDLCFSRTTDAEHEEESKKQLLDTVPFARVGIITTHTNDQSMVIATNTDLYETFAELCTDLGYTVEFVVPWAAIVTSGVSAHGEVDRVTVKRVFDAKSQLQPMSFPCEHGAIGEEKPEDTHKTTAPKKLPIGWIIFGLIALIYAITMYWFFIRR